MKLKKFIALLLASAVLLSVIYFGTLSLLKTLYPLKYEDYVEVYSKENNLSPAFVYAVIKCESDFDNEAVSSVGATGLMQIMPDTFDWINMKLDDDIPYSMATDPETNIKYGCYLYGYLLTRYGRVQEALTAYHAGNGNVDKWLRDEAYSSDGKTLHTIPFPTTNKYVKKVIMTENIYEKLYFRKEQ
ncbi:MAG: lytic transglycosylase domain-containing protein [Clostridia bacterium]|nr:lytic transglycosylase domain-containing protein [Clostridia bacterium]MBO7319457.1 lytic transglycosylase domain-containing protein [Clostridia bacterium]